MKNTTAQLFISQHPASLLFYKNLIRIIKGQDPTRAIILLKINHEYFKAFNFDLYAPYFDSVFELPFIRYEKNVIAGIRNARAFLRRSRQIMDDLTTRYDRIHAVFERSAALPVNALYHLLSKRRSHDTLSVWFMDDYKTHHDSAPDPLRTTFTELYRLFLPTFPIVALARKSSRKFVDFSYREKTPGDSVQIISPLQTEAVTSSKDFSLPFPLIQRDTNQKAADKNQVIIFGDASIVDHYAEYLLPKKEALRRLAILFNAIKAHYPNRTILYKPHPADKTPMPSVIKNNFTILNNSKSAQEILEENHDNIQAAYTFTSSSVVWSSFFGIPSYSFYRYLCNKQGIRRFDDLFLQPSINSPALFHLEHIDQIGQIDKLTISLKTVDTKNPHIMYRTFLHL